MSSIEIKISPMPTRLMSQCASKQSMLVASVMRLHFATVGNGLKTSNPVGTDIAKRVIAA